MEETIRTEYSLKLYIYGRTDKSESARRTLQRIAKRHLDGRCRFEIIDLSERPDLGAEDNILATPTLIRKHPLPECRIIGDLTRVDEVASVIILPEE